MTLKIQRRRQLREQEACMQSDMNKSGPDEWTHIAPLLDPALAELAEKDHNAIVLRFFENKNMRDIGLALGTSEDAAKMRVNRALEKLRLFFSKRGLTLSAGVIAGAISAHSVQAAPAALTKTATAVAMAKGATASGSTLILINGALKIMAWTKAKIAGVAGVVLILATGITLVLDNNRESGLRMDQAKKLALICRLFAEAHGGQLPNSFEQLQSDLADSKIFSGLSVSNWEIVSSGNLSNSVNPGQIIMLREKEPGQGAHDGFVKVYAFADGHAELLFSPDKNFTAVEKKRGLLAQPAKN